MKNLLNNPWVVGGLCILALITVYFRLFDSKKRPDPPPVVVAQAQAQATAVAPLPIPVTQNPASASPPSSISLEDFDFSWPEKFRHDPFQPHRTGSTFSPGLPNDFNDSVEGAPPFAQVPLLLHAVFLEGPNRVAMINRDLVKEGEQIDGYVVDQIQRDRVRLKGEDETRWLDFNALSNQPSSDPLNEDGLEALLDKDLLAS